MKSDTKELFKRHANDSKNNKLIMYEEDFDSALAEREQPQDGSISIRFGLTEKSATFWVTWNYPGYARSLSFTHAVAEMHDPHDGERMKQLKELFGKERPFAAAEQREGQPTVSQSCGWHGFQYVPCCRACEVIRKSQPSARELDDARKFYEEVWFPANNCLLLADDRAIAFGADYAGELRAERDDLKRQLKETLLRAEWHRIRLEKAESDLAAVRAQLLEVEKLANACNEELDAIYHELTQCDDIVLDKSDMPRMICDVQKAREKAEQELSALQAKLKAVEDVLNDPERKVPYGTPEYFLIQRLRTKLSV